MTDKGKIDRYGSHSHLSYDWDPDITSLHFTSHSNDSNMAHAAENRCPSDLRDQSLPSVWPPPPRLTPVAASQSQVTSLPIRPFPLLEFLQSDELAVLQAALEDSDEGECIFYYVMLLDLTCFHCLCSSQMWT